jgi:hypothetical protein
VIEGTINAMTTQSRATETAYIGSGSPLNLSLDVTPLPARGNQQVLVEMVVSNPTASTINGAVVQLRYPSNMNYILESGDLVTGPVNPDDSCTGANAAACTEGEILQWAMGDMAPGQVVHLSLSPTVANGTADGTMIPWTAMAYDDSTMLTFTSETLPIGVGGSCFSDSDSDGICDEDDNCTLIPNADQRDTDGDDYGNRCDADLDNSGLVNSLDIGLFKERILSTDEDADFNGDGIVNSLDIGIFKQLFMQPPGPSGLVP